MSTSQKSFTLKSLKQNKTFVIIFSLALLVLLTLLSISMGSVKIPIKDIAKIAAGGEVDKKFETIILHVRLPRTLAAILAGAALTTSGAILQNVLNNTLAAPNIVGVNSGAGLFVVLLAALFPQYTEYTPLAAFCGAIIAVCFVYFLSKATGASRTTTVLAGVAVSSFCTAISDTVITTFPDITINRTAFSIGSYAGITMSMLKFPAILIVIGLVLSIVFSFELNILAHGEEQAKSLGLRTGIMKAVYFSIVAILAGSAVSFAGLVSFVGLIVPHIVRTFTGNDNRYLIPLCIICGASFSLFCDIIARTFFAPFEIPVGIVMSFIGAPFFIYLLMKKRRRFEND